MDNPDRPKLYRQLAGWWPLFSAPQEYVEEAALYRELLDGAARRPLRRVLELGCGAGNNASHLKAHFEMTPTDISAEMIEISRRINPECDHLLGDMRTLRLGRTFDGIFVHDAIDYIRTEEDLAATMLTVAEHCEAGSAVLIAPDHIAETFADSTSHGGGDGDGRALRYLE